MPTAAVRPCAGGCGAKVSSGRCATCARHREQRRGTSTARGYGYRWTMFRPRFIAMLIDQGITPVCGAALPSGPQTTDSQCKADGYLTWQGLHLDHEPPLTDSERTDNAIVCDPHRIQLLCGSRCHAAKTARQTQRGGW